MWEGPFVQLSIPRVYLCFLLEAPLEKALLYCTQKQAHSINLIVHTLNNENQFLKSESLSEAQRSSCCI